METQPSSLWVAFGGKRLVASGAPRQVAERLLEWSAARPDRQPQVFDACTSEVVELDLRGSRQSVLRRLPPAPVAGGQAPGDPAQPDAARGPGRPRLGVVAREVTLLPRHWEWLTAQPGGASVALRKLVEQAMRSSRESDRVRLATESAYRFMHALAGDEPGFEEAARALFARDTEACARHMAAWPKDVRAHATALVARIASTDGADAAPATAGGAA